MHKHRRDAGFSLAALIFFATAASIFIAAAVPAYQMQAKRELEEELIFRGGEYTRAIQKYQRKFGIYPTSIDQLVSTNSLRFVRRAYKDPITGKDFRLISVNPDGSINGSKLFTQNINNQSMFGNNTQQFGQGQTPNQQPQNNSMNGPANGTQSGTRGFGSNTSSFSSSFSSPQGTQNGTTPFNSSPQNSTSSFGSPFGSQPQTGANQPGASGVNRVGGGVSPPTGLGGTQIASGGIIGVASDSEKGSIKIYNNRQKYNEWEFIAILGQQGQQQNGQNPQQNPGTQPANGQRGNNPFATGNSPFGGAPTGATGATQQNGNFGFGGNPTPPTQPGKLP